jgi:hypothetical protein
MNIADVTLLYSDYIPDSTFEELENELDSLGVELHKEPHEGGPQAGLELYAITAIAIYLAKPFVDDLLKRAAQDVNDQVYPSLKSVLTGLVQKIFVRDRRIHFVGTPGKITTEEALMFALLTETQDGKRVKFVFISTLADEEYAVAIEGMFQVLRNHRSPTDGADILSNNTVPKSSWRPIVLTYNPETRSWELPAK